MESYVERPPLPGLAGVVRTVWIQRTGEAAYVQRHLPTGGVKIHFPIGGQPQLLGPGPSRGERARAGPAEGRATAHCLVRTNRPHYPPAGITKLLPARKTGLPA